jgi:small-conductance mechanosensitive channel
VINKMPGTFRANGTFHAMTNQTHFDSRPSPRRGLSALFLLLGVVIGGGAMALAGPHTLLTSAPPPTPQATIPSETTQAIQDLQAGQQKVTDQLQAIQQTLASDQANAKQLSSQVSAVSDKLTSQVNAVSDKLEALRQSFASQAAPPAEPARRRGTR